MRELSRVMPDSSIPHPEVKQGIDELESALRAFLGIPQWTKDKYAAKQVMLDTSERHRMYRFRTRAQFFHLPRLPHIGETSIVNVSELKYK